MKLTIFKRNLDRMMLLVWLNFAVFVNSGSTQPRKECYNGCTCQTWFDYPACIAIYWYPDLCKCCEGYEMKNCQCVDIDECTMLPSPCDQICTNRVGSYKCTCRRGYTYSQREGKCVSSGPCFEGAHFCSHICKPLGMYTYECACNPGFVLAADDITCIRKT